MKRLIISAILVMLFIIPLRYQSILCAAETMGLPTTGFNPLGGPPYPTNVNSYFTDDYGNILMRIKVIGMVNRTGEFIVRENADFTTVLTLCGGVIDGVNLKKIRIVRYEPDDDGKQIHMVNLKSFYNKGDRSEFIAFKPNDTIIFPEKSISLAKIAKTLSMIMPFVYFYDLISGN